MRSISNDNEWETKPANPKIIEIVKSQFNLDMRPNNKNPMEIVRTVLTGLYSVNFMIELKNSVNKWGKCTTSAKYYY